MVEINPTRISGRGSNGFTLDVHTASSELLGHDEYGHPQFASKRSELGELLYKLKFRRDQSVIPEIAAVVGTFAESYLPTVDLIVPVPPSTPRTEQPVILLAHAIGARIGIPVFEDCVWKVRETSQLKNIFDFDERLRLLDGAFEDRSFRSQWKKWYCSSTISTDRAPQFERRHQPLVRSAGATGCR